MASFMTNVIVVLISLVISFKGSSGSIYAKAVIESCRGCTLNRLPDVKAFIFEDVPHYDGVDFKHIQGAIPELVLYDTNNEIVERLQLSRLTREECNELLVSKGFPRDSRPAKDEI